MTSSRWSGAAADGAPRLDAVAKRSLEVARERTMVDEVVGRLREDERRLRLDVAALKEDRRRRELELAETRSRLQSVEGTLTVRQLGSTAKQQELDAARSELERQRERARHVEREILDARRQIDATQSHLAGLVERAVHMQNRLWRGSQLTAPSRDERDPRTKR